MIKNLIHSGTFVGYGDRKIKVNFYKRGYFLTLKEGVESIINVPSEGQAFTFKNLFNTNGTITGVSNYYAEFGNTYVMIKENTFYYEVDRKITFKLREDEDVKVTIIFRQAGAVRDLTANPESMLFSGRQEFLPLELSSANGEPIIYGFNGDIYNYIMSETDQPVATRLERDGTGWKDIWYIGMEVNNGGEQRMGGADVDVERPSMGGMYVPIVQDSIEYDFSIIADLYPQDGSYGKQVEISRYYNEGDFEFYYYSGDGIENTTVELVDVGYGTDWVNIIEPIQDPFRTSVYFTVAAVPRTAEYNHRCVIFRVHNADRPDDYAECMLIQNNF